MTAYYNEHDPGAAAWLRELINAGVIAKGEVDERDIRDIRPSELAGFTQCHFFAGIGGWAEALRLAGWPDDRPVWTGSCPCQPFSAAGKGAGFADERHLWPAWFHLIKECSPSVIFGEQVASKHADPWIDLVQADLEAVGYAVGAVPFPAAGVGAPHIRDRLYWVAVSDNAERRADGARGYECDGQDAGRSQSAGDAEGCSELGGLADAAGIEREWGRTSGAGAEPGAVERSSRLCAASAGPSAASPTNGFWRDADWLFCRDGKWRPVEPGTFPLAHGIPARVGRLRGYGNAIVPQAAAEFILAYASAANCQSDRTWEMAMSANKPRRDRP